MQQNNCRKFRSNRMEFDKIEKSQNVSQIPVIRTHFDVIAHARAPLGVE